MMEKPQPLWPCLSVLRAKWSITILTLVPYLHVILSAKREESLQETVRDQLQGFFRPSAFRMTFAIIGFPYTYPKH
jgi:hypothetical protein